MWCGCTRYLPKLHTIPSGYYSSTRNFKITQYVPLLLQNSCTREHIIVFFLIDCFFYEKSVFKVRIGKLNLSEPMKHFLLLPSAIISWQLLIFVSLMNGLYIFLATKIRGQTLPMANKEQLNHLYTHIFQDVLLPLNWEKRERLSN